uniref:Uncharacterized protein n=1 Tax=Caulobacter phage BL57 TaxID=3348355 RepID=A0AB74UGV6_9VIRU
MATRKAAPTPINIVAIQNAADQVDNLIRQDHKTYLETAVVNQAIDRVLAGFDYKVGTGHFTGDHNQTLRALESIAPGARVDVSYKDEVKGGLFNKKTTKLTSVRISGKYQEVGFAGWSTQPHEDPALAVLSAFANALLDLGKRIAAANRTGDMSSTNAPQTNRKDKLIDEAKVQGIGGEDVAAERTRASGTSRTPLLPEGYKPRKGRLDARPTTGSLKNPAAARLPKAPR